MVPLKDQKIRLDYNHAEIVRKYKELYEKDPYENPRIILKQVFSKFKGDFVEDASMPTSKIPGGNTELQKKFKELGMLIKARSESKKLGVETKIDPVQSITAPFTIINSETGAIVQGEVIEQLQEGIKQLTPVSSSNVKGVGQNKSELIVQFRPSGITPQRTYKYEFQDLSSADEAYKSLTSTGSPGRWIWENIRGHSAGENVSSNKLGPSLSPPGKGSPTIGGTNASLVDYSVSNRVPVTRVKGFAGMSNKLKRSTSNPVSNPQTGSRVESLLGARKELRGVGMPRSGQLSQLPKLDFGVEYVGKIWDFDDRKGKWITVRGKHIFIKKGEKLQFGHGGKVETVSKKEHAKVKEERTQRKIEKTGIQRKTAEKHVKKKRQAKKEKYGYKNISKENKKIETQDKINKKKEVLKTKYESLMKVNKGKPGGQILGEIIKLALKALDSVEKGDIVGLVKEIGFFQKKVKADHKLTEKQRINISNQINQIKNDIAKLEGKKDFRQDLIDLKDFTHITTDFQQDFTHFHGPITRSGPMDYVVNGKIVTYYKDWDNIQDIFPNYDYLPLKATPKKGAHTAEIKGYAMNWAPHADTEEMFADVILFDNLDTHISPEQFKSDYQVSMGYADYIKKDNTQLMVALDHLAMALGDEIGRACSGTNSKGASCSTVKKIQDQNLKEVVITDN